MGERLIGIACAVVISTAFAGIVAGLSLWRLTR